MNIITAEEFQVLLPLACEWAEAQEKHILENGVALTKDQIEDAKRVGVSHPEKVRLLKVYQIPLPEHPDLIAAVKITQLISPKSIGL
ncbi:MAG: hypothetical protein V3R78_07215, partial [Thermodesulfobacteriota bacterium]